MLFLDCHFRLRKSNDKIIFKAVVFRLLAQNHAITMYGQSRNEDFGKNKRFLSRRNFKNLHNPIICSTIFFNCNFSLKFRI